MTRIALISKPVVFQPTSLEPYTKSFIASGSNTGNNAFFHGIRKIIGGEHTFFDWSFNPEEINSDFDVAIFVSANHINAFSTFGELPRRLSELRIPLFVIGIGAQALSNKHEISLSPAVADLLDAIRKRASAIGARGEFTYDYLSKNDFPQAFVSGCPSNLINPAMNLGRTVAARLASVDLTGRIALCIDISNKFTNVTAKFRNILRDHTAFIVCQDPIDLMHAAFGNWAKIRPAYQKTICDFFALETEAEFRAFCGRYLYAFFDPAHAMHHAKCVQLAYGTKMHGNMFCFQSGTPTITIMHDSRIHELTEFMKLPRIPASRLNPKFSLAEDLAEVVFDGALYDQARISQAATIKGKLDSLGIPTTPHLDALAGMSVATA